ncbi:cbb3-type cytochrome c oxidase subunit I [Echinicola marina]|uniref:cbb3-type cytochrome c oxidase subunit I n=1 Tax=Echinicola marina TaxID=2859768 RepID=UPI001CF69D36|nr:cbb3-type cytochrome c oxidase subunit I [Echinicola marina]
MFKILVWLAGTMVMTGTVIAQGKVEIDTSTWSTQPGVIGTVLLSVLVLVVLAYLMVVRLNKLMNVSEKVKWTNEREDLKSVLINLEREEVDELLERRKKAGLYRLRGNEIGGELNFKDEKGLIRKITKSPHNPLVDDKKSGKLKVETDDRLIRLIIAYVVAAAFWLIFGTLMGQYLGMKFVWPEMDQQPWLSFGRLRPVHTNTVFWGWASLGMLGLGYFVVSRTSNRSIFSYKLGWWTFYLINACVVLGNIALMNGLNNGGGEYREYIWPVMLLFAIGLILALINIYKTISLRNTVEIYISNWFILAALTWTTVLAIIGYLPFYQEGLGETVIQGYYMHQGVGMWFMTFTLGLVYYYLPASLNKPIYSYSLGVLAFWTQMLFYTLIGTHHFVFSPLPWWLQTVAIVFSAGMFIPVLAGTTNFMMTMKGSRKAIEDSYVLPFMLVGVIFYFVGSTQGSFQAFRFTNYIWHFTDFNVAHSHMTMYGIICFFLWGGMYSLLPKLTRKEPNQLAVGMHFWFAFIGLVIYMFSLMIGGTEKGMSWVDGQPFIDSVRLMAPYWLWRAVGGSLMFISHLVFGYNLYQMVNGYRIGRKRNTKIVKVKKDEYARFS